MEEQYYLNHVETMKFEDYIGEFKEFSVFESCVNDKDDYGKALIK